MFLNNLCHFMDQLTLTNISFLVALPFSKRISLQDMRQRKKHGGVCKFFKRKGLKKKKNVHGVSGAAYKCNVSAAQGDVWFSMSNLADPLRSLPSVCDRRFPPRLSKCKSTGKVTQRQIFKIKADFVTKI